MRSWPKKWNDTAMRRLAWRYERPRTTRWSLLGMLALGLVAGAAVGGYAVSQRWRLKRLSEYANRMLDMRAEMGMPEGKAPTIVTVPRSNHRRKATSEV
jgi:hypothetical protein